GRERRRAGRRAGPAGAAAARAGGIVLIPRALTLAETLGVAATLSLGREPARAGWIGWLDRGRERQAARQLMQRVGLDVPPDTRVGALPPGQRQLVEVARAPSLSARLIIMDEPTSRLTQPETDRP